MITEWTERNWGRYKVLTEFKDTMTGNITEKVKILEIDPNQKLSIQRHKHRSELWHPVNKLYVKIGASVSPYYNEYFGFDQWISISTGKWHQLFNPTDKPITIIEIQSGINCIEEDIERVSEWNLTL